MNEEEAKKLAEKYYGKDTELNQDDDVNILDVVIIVQMKRREIELIPTFCQHEKNEKYFRFSVV